MSQRKRSILADILAGVLVSSAEQGQPAGDTAGDSGAAVASPAKPRQKTQPDRRRKRQTLPPWNVVLLDDDDHTYEYVIEMLGRVFGHNTQRAFLMAREVDASGRVVVYTTHRELAELKREQIIRYGLDPRIAACRGSMGAIIEPAQS